MIEKAKVTASLLSKAKVFGGFRKFVYLCRTFNNEGDP